MKGLNKTLRKMRTLCSISACFFFEFSISHVRFSFYRSTMKKSDVSPPSAPPAELISVECEKLTANDLERSSQQLPETVCGPAPALYPMRASFLALVLFPAPGSAQPQRLAMAFLEQSALATATPNESPAQHPIPPLPGRCSPFLHRLDSPPFRPLRESPQPQLLLLFPY